MSKPKYEFVAVDFDGTLCADAFPEIGEPNPVVIDYVKKLAAEGSKIILHTCRENGTRKLLDEAVAFCNAQEIPLFAVNENPGNLHPARYGLSPNDGRKVYADLYIDDKALNPAGLEWGGSLKRTQPKRYPLPPEAGKADDRWAEVMKLAKQCGFILQAAGGTAIIATNRVQIEENGVEDYARIQRMNGRCPQEIGLPGCFDSMTGEPRCIGKSCELWERRKHDDRD